MLLVGAKVSRQYLQLPNKKPSRISSHLSSNYLKNGAKMKFSERTWCFQTIYFLDYEKGEREHFYHL